MPNALLTDRIYRTTLCTSVLAAIGAAIGYAVFIAHWSHNLPISDDYRDILGFIQCMDNSQQLLQKTGCFFAKNNSHVTLTNHIVYWVQFTLLGHINFQHLQWLGNLQIPLLVIILYAGLKTHLSEKSLLLALTALSLFQIQWWEAALWSMTSLSNFSVIVFALLSIYCLSLPASKSSATACIGLAILASWSQINGLVLWPILFLHWINSGKSWSKASAQLIPFAALACLPFLLIATDANAARIWEMQRALPALLFAPISTLALLGSAIGLDHQRVTLSLIAGLPVTGYALYITFKSRELPINFLTGSVLFLMGSAVMIAVGRYGSGHLELVMQSRYKLYPTLLMLLLAVHYLGHRRESKQFKSIATCLLIMFMLFNAGSWSSNTAHAKTRIEKHKESTEIWLMSGNSRDLAYSILFIDNPDYYISHAIKNSRYRPLSWLSQSNHADHIQHTHCPTATEAHRIDIFPFRNTLLDTQSFEIQLWAWDSTITSPPSVLLCGENNDYKLALDDYHWRKTNIAEMRRAKIFIQPPAHNQAPIAPGRYEVLIENPLSPDRAWRGAETVWISIPETE